MVRNTVVLGLFGCLAVASLPVWGQSQGTEGEHMAETQQVVRIGANNLLPESLSLKANEVIAWINYSGVPVRISFVAETVKKIRCQEPTRFHIASDGSLTSEEVRPFEAAALCSFLPGEYHYTVSRQVSAGIAKPVTRDSSGHVVVTQ